MRGARQFTKQIEIWQTTTVPDGFGGNTVTEEILTRSWANVTTLGGRSRVTDFGVTDTNNTILVKLRKRNDITYNSINQFIMYRGVKYIISSFPENVDFNDVYIDIVCIRELQRTVNDLPPVGGEVYPYTYDYILS